MGWVGGPIVPRNGRVSRITPVRICLMGELVNGGNMEINQSLYTIDKDQLGCQHGRWLCVGASGIPDRRNGTAMYVRSDGDS